MKKSGLLFLALITFVASYGQKKKELKVAQAVEHLKQAMVSGSQQELEAIASDDLTYVHSHGKIQNKAEFVEAIVSGKSDFVSIVLTDQKIKLSGKTAVVTHKLAADTNDNNKPGKVELGVMLVFQKEHGQWKLLARQAFHP